MTYEHVGQMITEKVKEYTSQTALRFKENDAWRSLTYAEFGEKINRLACALVHANVQKGDNVGIYSANRYEWAVTDFACSIAGAVSVPIYATNTKEQARFIIKDAGIKLIFVGNAFQYQNIETIISEAIPLTVIAYDSTLAINPSFAHYFNDFIDITPEAIGQNELHHRQELIKKDDTTTIIYTSGTTGNPKGVMLTHGNLFHQFDAIDTNFNVTSKDTSLCFLPLSHVYERMWSYYVYRKGAVHTYLEDPKKVIETLQEIKPTAMVSVPRLYEKIYATVMNRQETASFMKKILFKQAIKTGKTYYTRRKNNQPISLGLKLKHKIFDTLVLSKVRGVVGGEKNFFSAGGAPLEKSIEEFFFNCGLLVCQGYGLTETSPMISYNTPGCFKFGTVGKLVPNCQVRIDDNGEIQVKGPQVMKGYYNNPEKTAETIVDGWFKTGDVGEFDADGFLKITDRIKDLIITSGGKNIAPQQIETLVGKDFFIEQVVAIGDKRKFISALIVPSFEALEAWAEKKAISYTSMDELVNHPEVIRFYRKRIDYHSKLLAQYETIKEFKLLSRPFTIEGEEITPTLKLKRKSINKRYKDVIDDMY
ncbi:long-chain fatty acid--CoA ligase [Desulfobacula sp.]|uniref:AMP-dependent synthetase/ligase n=1 Tax=Desulfobacula sp. TaxID=2593537 RepID=UPI00262DABEB|nr:long-chain fatty acid--CoA ligase [Desulfobacula sp.]